jgi:Rps23 Pro-64 3,4-dihydroxylase Tpa1-like proline 4-hydroxylase
MINDQNWSELAERFRTAEPYPHVVIDNFWKPEVADQILAEFPEYESPKWNAHYNNPIEDKKAFNHWDNFKATSYKAFAYLNSEKFIDLLRQVTGTTAIYPDIGLHGGGFHGHHRGGKLNVHLDYNIHPKLQLQRKYNLIVYMTPNWQPEWNGGLGLWSHDNETGGPRDCVTTVENRFNRAVIFDTTCNSWHGLPESLMCPEDNMRRSMAIYYLTDPPAAADPRPRALFVPYKEQANDPEILELIKRRSQL